MAQDRGALLIGDRSAPGRHHRRCDGSSQKGTLWLVESGKGDKRGAASHGDWRARASPQLAIVMFTGLAAILARYANFLHLSARQ
jgi:hypothetical protein